MPNDEGDGGHDDDGKGTEGDAGPSREPLMGHRHFA